VNLSANFLAEPSGYDSGLGHVDVTEAYMDLPPFLSCRFPVVFLSFDLPTPEEFGLIFWTS
jgi:hypothetical protein